MSSLLFIRVMMQVFYTMKDGRERKLHDIKTDPRKSWTEFELQRDIEELKHQGVVEFINKLESVSQMRFLREPADRRLNPSRYDLMQTLAEHSRKVAVNAN